MGAKQSKRSVDISGKEAEGASEVAAAGAGGEGRVEPIADVDALKPTLNGDAHIHENTDKEKLDSGTPENEKDATTEKEGEKEKPEEKAPVAEGEKEKAAEPVTNGDSEAKPEGEATPEEGKKPKKEKVKKKWSLRSISFSRKDKPKQEKKHKDKDQDEAKTNGDADKLPEEAAEATPEPAATEAAEPAKPATEVKEEKTPETPVTEPLTNGSSPASPAAEPDQLPLNGLSLDEPKAEEAEPKPATTETAPEIPKEVCVEQALESTPPPLPANPPPSGAASLATSTMAPETPAAVELANGDASPVSPPLTPSAPIDDNTTSAPEQITQHIETAAPSEPTPEPVNTPTPEPVNDGITLDQQLVAPTDVDIETLSDPESQELPPPPPEADELPSPDDVDMPEAIPIETTQTFNNITTDNKVIDISESKDTLTKEVDIDIPVETKEILTKEVELNGHVEPVNGMNGHEEIENVKNKAKDVEETLLNGDVANGDHHAQEPVAVSDKLADLIPDVPVVPELNTETLQETTTDIVAAN